MFNVTFSTPDLTAFCRLDELGLTTIGQHLDADRAIIECRVNEPDPWCRRCGAESNLRDTVTRKLAHEPFGHRPTTLLIRVRRYRCDWCKKVWREDLTQAADERSKISRSGVRWALEALVLDHLTVSRVSTNLGVSWHTANTAVLEEGHRLLIDDPARFDGVRVIGVDEHVWCHTRYGDKYVTVIIDLTPVEEKRGPARLLDMVPGRTKHVFSTWLKQRKTRWRDGIDVVAMDGFTGFKTATTEQLPDATVVMDPFHVVKLAGDALEKTRQRVQVETLGRRGRKHDPLYKARRVLLTGESYLTPKQQGLLALVFADPAHGEVERMWRVYQQVVAAYREKYPPLGRKQLRELIDSLQESVAALAEELRKLSHTLDRRRKDILAYFDHPGTSNGPTEAINGRLEHLRGSALGFRNLTNYIARSLLEAGGFRPLLHP